ncbi:hypothetical protein Clacol_006249 [Clathrus columnatus]|uniref:hydroxyacylglutathione hydrolase n=1 Tax=Clathrus columnatus TaxID=1419009 RepID=A0AAV5AGC1_9AGAM|nr:hypothetical protein Clacol_006249 [Clathrus columnatus]
MLRLPRPTVLTRTLSTSARFRMRVVPIPNQSDNYAYLLIDDASNKAAAVDPYDVPKVTAAAKQEGVEIVAGITTHHHRDHSGGNTEFVNNQHHPRNYLITYDVLQSAKYSSLPMYAGSNTAPAITNVVKDKDEFELGENIKIRALHTPCHTQDSTCFYVHDTKTGQNGVFTGLQCSSQQRSLYLFRDTLFRGGCGRFFEGTAEEMHSALSYLGTLPDSTVLYDGHEYTKGSYAFGRSVDPQGEGIQALGKLVASTSETTGKSTIGDEKKWNVFMRVDDSVIKDATGETDAVKVMAKLRSMKNNFKG